MSDNISEGLNLLGVSCLIQADHIAFTCQLVPLVFEVKQLGNGNVCEEMLENVLLHARERLEAAIRLLRYELNPMEGR